MTSKDIDSTPRAVLNGMSQAEYNTWIFLSDKPNGDKTYTYIISQEELTQFLTNELEKAAPTSQPNKEES